MRWRLTHPPGVDPIIVVVIVDDDVTAAAVRQC